MAEPLFTGVGVALVTLFDRDGRVRAGATAEHAAGLVERDVRAVLLAGTTGEAARLTLEDRLELLRAAREALGERVPLVVGTGQDNVEAAMRMTRAVAAAGADAAIALTPAGEDDPRGYYESVVEAGEGMPVLGYHYPAVSAPGIDVEALADLPIAGLKDSSGDADRLLRELDAFDRPLYVGSAAYLSLAGPLGATGAILGLANTQPELCAAAFGGDHDAQRALVAHHLEMRRDFPDGLKPRA
jgi:4-hydroxy-tetrahydrodipicolinate synthase